MIGILAKKFPQLRLVYVSSRTYGGYSESELSPEPIAYESAFAVKWLIEERINNPGLEASQPWLSWGSLPVGQWLDAQKRRPCF